MGVLKTLPGRSRVQPKSRMGRTSEAGSFRGRDSAVPHPHPQCQTQAVSKAFPVVTLSGAAPGFSRLEAGGVVEHQPVPQTSSQRQRPNPNQEQPATLFSWSVGKQMVCVLIDKPGSLYAARSSRT